MCKAKVFICAFLSAQALMRVSSWIITHSRPPRTLIIIARVVMGVFGYERTDMLVLKAFVTVLMLIVMFLIVVFATESRSKKDKDLSIVLVLIMAMSVMCMWV